MKGDDSPEMSKRNVERDCKILQQISRTPKGKKIGLDDLHLLGLHRDSSPNAYGSSQDNLEIGWGDSPEPLKIKEKPTFDKTRVSCKKPLDPTESPKSRCKNLRPSLKAASQPPVDVAKYIAEVQELSKRIMNKLENEKQVVASYDESSLNDELTNECLLACSQALESQLGVVSDSSSSSSSSCSSSAAASQQQQQQQLQRLSASSSTDAKSDSDSAFEKVLQSFITEEDDWLSEVVLNAESNAGIPPRKSNFVKTKSEMTLSSPGVSYRSDVPLAKRSNGLRGVTTFRRTHSTERISSGVHGKRANAWTSDRKTGSLANNNNNNGGCKRNFADKPKLAHESVRKGFG